MNRLIKLLIPLSLAALAGCVVVPVSPRGYVRGPHVAIVAPAPLVVVHPYYRYRW